uniref:Family with sequence similarity 131 member C n=1 Tax=Terrapene triunguis TaxID=2587831 RepID=A0A674J6L2_9SAUR
KSKPWGWLAGGWLPQCRHPPSMDMISHGGHSFSTKSWCIDPTALNPARFSPAPPVSALGLVQTIKDHITKPTAMARGRVAHLIEWKGWSAPQVGCEPWLTEEEHYSYLTDELREARFAAGVAEQFAITEATLSAWSSLDDEEMNYGGSSQEIVQLQGTFPLLSAMSGPAGLLMLPSPPCMEQIQEGPSGPSWLVVGQKRLSNSLHYVDSSSLSEDEVFYN